MEEGRPSKYGPDIIEKTKNYLANYSQFGDVIPSVAGLSTAIKIARSTIYDWAKHEDKKEFSDILDEILSDQERTLINKGLKGEFNATITKLALGKHGYKDNTDMTTNNKDLPAQPVLVKFLNGSENTKNN